MERHDDASGQSKQESGTSSELPVDKKPWEEPKLAFVEPKLTRHGNLEKVTGMPNGGFFGGFSP